MKNEKDSLFPFAEYNTQQTKLILPEYGRHIQNMVRYVAQIKDPKKRNEQIMILVSIMGNLNPHLRDINDFKHKLWDHVQIISDFNIDIDSPYPIPSRESFQEKPKTIPYPTTSVRIMHYGRNAQNLIDAIAARPETEDNEALLLMMGNFMKRQYLLWNKESVTDDLIFRDIKLLSNGRIKIRAGLKLADIQDEISREMNNKTQNKPPSAGKKKKKKKKKNPETSAS
jgi:hypothetical protein